MIKISKEPIKRRSTICLDFDGVVHSYASGWKGATVIPDPIVPGAIAFMLTLLVNGYDVCIFSSRSGAAGGLGAMRTWLKNEAGSAWFESPAGPGIESVRLTQEKPAAIMYIDDRGYYFTGKWPTLEFIREFKTWQGK